MEAAKYYREAAVYWRTNRQYEQACKTLQKAAVMIGKFDDEEAIKVFSECCEIEEDEKRFKLCHPFFEAAVKFCVAQKRYDV